VAEYKTYTCDICGKQEAKPLRIPDVDYESPDPAGGRTGTIDGPIDLCADHMGRLLTVFFSEVQTTMEQRRAIWKRLHNQKK
jgi:hypothetical protein